MQEGSKLSLYFTPICTTFFQGVAERKNSQASSAPNAQLHNHLFSFGYPDWVIFPHVPDVVDDLSEQAR